MKCAFLIAINVLALGLVSIPARRLYVDATAANTAKIKRPVRVLIKTAASNNTTRPDPRQGDING